MEHVEQGPASGLAGGQPLAVLLSMLRKGWRLPAGVARELWPPGSSTFPLQCTVDVHLDGVLIKQGHSATVSRSPAAKMATFMHTIHSLAELKGKGQVLMQ